MPIFIAMKWKWGCKEAQVRESGGTSGGVIRV